MSRFTMIDPASAEGETKTLLEATHKQLGKAPNLYRAMANSPAALKGYLAFRDALQTGGLNTRLKEQLALLTAQENGCEYCVSAHTFRGGKLGLTTEEMQANRQARSTDAKTETALLFARSAMATKGNVGDNLIQRMHEAGWSNADMGEIIAHIALNTFSNLFNHVARPELDFPQVQVDENAVEENEHV